MRCFVSAGSFTKAFVSGSQEDDSDEGNEERKCTGDVPLGENDTEVFSGPGKQHLNSNGH